MDCYGGLVASQHQCGCDVSRYTGHGGARSTREQDDRRAREESRGRSREKVGIESALPSCTKRNETVRPQSAVDGGKTFQLLSIL